MNLHTTQNFLQNFRDTICPAQIVDVAYSQIGRLSIAHDDCSSLDVLALCDELTATPLLSSLLYLCLGMSRCRTQSIVARPAPAACPATYKAKQRFDQQNSLPLPRGGEGDPGRHNPIKAVKNERKK